MTGGLPLIVTRPEPGNAATVERAREMGFDARAMPLFAARALDWAAPPVEDFDALLLVTGIFCGSTLWWVILSTLASCLRDKASGYWMRRLNQGCGIAVAVFGLVQIARVLVAACR